MKERLSVLTRYDYEYIINMYFIDFVFYMHIMRVIERIQIRHNVHMI